jgi:hypothetical protein
MNSPLTSEKVTSAEIMTQAQVFASAWSLVGGCFDSGSGLEDAEEAKAELRAMVEQLQQESTDRFNAGVNIAAERASMRRALEVCGRYLATLNSGGTDGYNASCRVVEEALGLDSLHQLKRAAERSES